MTDVSPRAAREAADALGDLSNEALAETVMRALSPRVGARRAGEVRAVVASVLAREQTVLNLAGPPVDVVESLHEQSQQTVITALAHQQVNAQQSYTSTAAGQALGRNASSAREAASSERLSGRLIGLPRGRQAFVFPAFQFDLDSRRVHPVVADVNLALDALNDPWGVASWWVAPTSRLVGRAAPMDLIGTGRDDDLRALAAAETEE